MDIAQENISTPAPGLFARLSNSTRKQLRKSFLHFHLWWALEEKKFSIISNNCWGGRAYADANCEYLTPTIGLFIEPACYLLLLKNFRRNLALPLSFVPTSRYAHINKRREGELGKYPIGLLDDAIEIHFQHYASEEEARQKWTRRATRVPADDRCLFFKFDDIAASPDQLVEFDALPFPNKIAILARKNPAINCGIWLPRFASTGLPPNGNDLYWACQTHVNIAAWLSGQSPRAAGSYRIFARIFR